MTKLQNNAITKVHSLKNLKYENKSSFKTLNNSNTKITISDFSPNFSLN